MSCLWSNRKCRNCKVRVLVGQQPLKVKFDFFQVLPFLIYTIFSKISLRNYLPIGFVKF